jgi:hypothetical protein
MRNLNFILGLLFTIGITWYILEATGTLADHITELIEREIERIERIK